MECPCGRNSYFFLLAASPLSVNVSVLNWYRFWIHISVAIACEM